MTHTLAAWYQHASACKQVEIYTKQVGWDIQDTSRGLPCEPFSGCAHQQCECACSLPQYTAVDVLTTGIVTHSLCSTHAGELNITQRLRVHHPAVEYCSLVRAVLPPASVPCLAIYTNMCLMLFPDCSWLLAIQTNMCLLSVPDCSCCQVCGDAEVWGDFIVPVAAAHLDGAINVDVDDCFHSPLGTKLRFFGPW